MDEPLARRELAAVSRRPPLPYSPRNQVPREMTRARHGRDARRVRARGAGGRRAPASTCSSCTWRTAICSRASSRRSRTGATTSTAASLENRLRFPLEVFDAVRAVWPTHKPITRAHLGDRLDPTAASTPTTPSRSPRAAEHGCDIIDVSTRADRAATTSRVFGRMCQTPFADRIRNEAGIPTIAVGASRRRRRQHASSPRAAPTCARSRARTSTTRTGRCTRPRSRATADPASSGPTRSRRAAGNRNRKERRAQAAAAAHPRRRAPHPARAVAAGHERVSPRGVRPVNARPWRARAAQGFIDDSAPRPRWRGTICVRGT